MVPKTPHTALCRPLAPHMPRRAPCARASVWASNASADRGSRLVPPRRSREAIPHAEGAGVTATRALQNLVQAILSYVALGIAAPHASPTYQVSGATTAAEREVATILPPFPMLGHAMCRWGRSVAAAGADSATVGQARQNYI